MSKFSFSALMNTLAQYGIALLVFCVITYFMINTVFRKVTKESDEKFQSKMQELQNSISVIQSKQDGLMNVIDKLEENNAYISGMISENNNKIDQNNKVLNNLKREYHETIRSVDNYSVSDLDSIFSKKYGKDFSKE